MIFQRKLIETIRRVKHVVKCPRKLHKVVFYIEILLSLKSDELL